MNYFTPVFVTILFYASGERFDLELVEVFDGERDDRRNLQQEGGVQFRTDKGKKWFLKFSEFAFVFEGIKPAEEPEMRKVEAVA